MSESKLKGYYGKAKELLGIIAVIIAIIAGLLAIVSHIYIPNSLTFEIIKDFFLVMIPVAVSMIGLQVVLGSIRRKLETKPQAQILPNKEQETNELDKRIDEIERNIEIVKGLAKRTDRIEMDIRTFKLYSERMDRLDNDIKITKGYFTFKCPSCSNPMFLPILPSTVMGNLIHLKDGYPDKYMGHPEYEIGCPSCQRTWHIVYV
jgi:hypothetical protein